VEQKESNPGTAPHKSEGSDLVYSSELAAETLL